MELEFWVTVCLGHGDGGDVTVSAEYDLLKRLSMLCIAP